VAEDMGQISGGVERDPLASPGLLIGAERKGRRGPACRESASSILPRFGKTADPSATLAATFGPLVPDGVSDGDCVALRTHPVRPVERGLVREGTTRRAVPL
jgi:hypothetical protein